MPADLFARLCADPAFRAAVLSMPSRALAPFAPTPRQLGLLQLTARRLQAGTQPPRCAYWWAVDPPSPAGGGD